MIDDRFYFVNYIGKGGSSKVFFAKDFNGNKFVLKVLRKDKNYDRNTAAEILYNEHQILEKLQLHPNIINSYGVQLDGIAKMGDEKEPIMYSVLEFAEHGSISNFVRYTGPIEERIAKFFFLQMCHAIEFIHQEGYAHLDIKLENILLDENFNIKIADMGASLNVEATNGIAYKRRGTLLYMAPEVIHKSSKSGFDSFKADVYSLGISLFVLLIGEFPNTPELMSVSSSTEDSRHCLERLSK